MKFWQIDAFTTEIFGGNPAAVFILNQDLDSSIKQKIAREMNLSETAFVLFDHQGIEIRWFTPNTEVDLCGHATLASGHVLWTQGFVKTDEVTLRSKSGPLKIIRKSKGYTLDFPNQPPKPTPANKALVAEILGQKPVYIGSNDHDCMAVVEDTAIIRSYVPNYAKIRELPERGFLITAQDKSDSFDFIYRAFFPKLDVPEDPVTGSANTVLAPYWAQQLNKNKLKAYQASERGGELDLELKQDRILITGQAVTVFEGELQGY